MLSLDDDERTDQILAGRWRGSHVLIEAFEPRRLAGPVAIDRTEALFVRGSAGSQRRSSGPCGAVQGWSR
jgi:hypothetical protein